MLSDSWKIFATKREYWILYPFLFLPPFPHVSHLPISISSRVHTPLHFFILPYLQLPSFHLSSPSPPSPSIPHSLIPLLPSLPLCTHLTFSHQWETRSTSLQSHHRAGIKPSPKSGGFIGSLMKSGSIRELFSLGSALIGARVMRPIWICSFLAAQTHIPDAASNPAPGPKQTPYIRGCEQSPGPGGWH